MKLTPIPKMETKLSPKTSDYLIHIQEVHGSSLSRDSDRATTFRGFSSVINDKYRDNTSAEASTISTIFSTHYSEINLPHDPIL